MQKESTSPIYQKTLAEVTSFISSPQTSEPAFHKAATQLHQYQLAENQAYKTFCKSIGYSLSKNWQNIPALTTDTFKHATPPSCLSAEQIDTTFMTSGTTGEVRGKHHFRSTELYETSILEAWKQLKLPAPTNLLILTPPPAQSPHSSLSHMMEVLRDKYCPNAKYLIEHDKLDPAPLLAAIEKGQPITLLGTALAFLNLFEVLDQPLQLPAGSWAMETGGYKGSGRTLTKEELYQLFNSHLGLAENDIWNEYSMTELSSQFYTSGIGQPHRSPHWMKIRVLDPETDQQVAIGEMGYLVIYDLANIDSVLALRTQDLAIYHDEHSFTLIGRDPSALPRGCSRSIDDALQKQEFRIKEQNYVYLRKSL